MKALSFPFALLLLLSSNVASAQNALGYREVKLGCHIPCSTGSQSDVLLNPWGIAFLPGQNFLIAEHDAGRVDSYDAAGVLASGFRVPLPAGSTATLSHPTGIVADPDMNFVQGTTRFQFFVATEEGTIVGFNIVNGVFQDARVVVDRSTTAVFTGLTLLHPSCCAPVLAAANFHDGEIDLFGLSATALPGAFEDPNLPDGYAAYNIQTAGNQVFVTYAKRDQSGRAAELGPGLGLINIFDQEGNFVRRFISEGGRLNAPWGVTATSASFGPFPNMLVVASTGDGLIPVFDPANGNFQTYLLDGRDFAIGNPGLRALIFRGDHTSDGVGDPDNLYFTAASTTGSLLDPDGLFAAAQVGRRTITQLSADAVEIGTETTLVAEVHPVSGGDISTGKVMFFDLPDKIGEATLSSGIATLQHTYAMGGSHTIIAAYQGTDNLLESFDVKTISVSGGDFQFTTNLPALTIASGGSANLTLTVNPSNGFAGSVLFGCTAPAGISCSFTPQSLTVTGAVRTATLTVSSTATRAGNSPVFGFALASFGVFGTFLIGQFSSAKKSAVTLIALLALGITLSACGGYKSQNSGGHNNPPQTFTLNVTATSGSVFHSTNVMVTVN